MHKICCSICGKEYELNDLYCKQDKRGANEDCSKHNYTDLVCVECGKKYRYTNPKLLGIGPKEGGWGLVPTEVRNED